VKLSLYLDEDTIARALVAGLRARGADVQTVVEAGLRGKDDNVHLEWAAAHKRTLYTFNVSDFCKLHRRIELTASQRESILAISEERRRIRWLQVTVAAAVVLLAVGLKAQWMRSARTQPRQVGNAAAKPAPPSAPALSQNAEVNSQASGRAHPIVMVDRRGKLIREIAPAEKYFGFRLSPDERQLAIDCCADSNSREIWLRDLVLGSLTRLTFGGASAPVWSPDGRVIVFSDPGTDRLYRQSSDGTGRRLALADGAEAALDFSPDGLILFQKRGEGLWVEPARYRRSIVCACAIAIQREGRAIHRRAQSVIQKERL